MRVGIYLGRWALHQLGGMGVYLKNLLAAVEALDQSEHELLLLADEKEGGDEWQLSSAVIPLHRPQWRDLSHAERRDAIRVRRQSHRSVHRADAMRSSVTSRNVDAYLWGLDDAVRNNNVDLLYFTLPPYVKQPTVPVLLTIHDLKHIHRPQDHSAADLARRRRWVYAARGAALVYASYEHVRRDIEQSLGVPREKTAVLPLACPTDLGTSQVQECRVPGFDLGKPFALMPAQFWPHKNHDALIRAVARLRKQHQVDVTVLCTGQVGGECAAHATAMKQLAERLGVGDLVFQAGFVDRATLIALYGKARLVVAPSLYEPGSFPAIEALALGRPLAASRITSIPATVGEAALLFDPNSVSELADAMLRLWSDEPLRRSLCQRGPRQIGTRTWQDVAEGWLDLCSQAVSTRTLEAVR